MSRLEPGRCRSGDCNRRAEFYAYTRYRRKDVRYRDRPRMPDFNWDGEFCMEHLMRCLEMKLRELPSHKGIKLERLVWE